MSRDKLQFKEYPDLLSAVKRIEHFDKNRNEINSLAKIYHIDDETLKMMFKLLNVEKKISKDTYKYKNGLIEMSTAAELVECLTFFGVKFDDLPNYIRILEWDSTGVYQEHDSYTTYSKHGSFHCKNCGISLPDFVLECDDCKRKKMFNSFDPNL